GSKALHELRRRPQDPPQLQGAVPWAGEKAPLRRARWTLAPVLGGAFSGEGGGSGRSSQWGSLRRGAEGMVAELLTAHGGLVHQAGLGGGEDRHPLLLVGGRRGAGRERHGAGLGRQREIALLEVGERGGVLEEDDLREGLAAELEPDGGLAHPGLPHRLAADEEHPVSPRSTYKEATL